MKKSDVLKFFGGTAATAAALNIKSPSVSGWGDEVPELRAYQIERLTDGELKVHADKAIESNSASQVA
ncbi:Cro/Cl family transcriptional regulator [Shewanella baltica]|uniref:Cro/CI family transcriptional regulator n=1 Tax=Shewanella TaxID=22 RepID=UPI00217CF204|nr:Cro/CI family transcriptional regulator [Shewanella baltica]MCS6126656.1 Cro/Cl family transcriptional regulator [Shewanella baltica]MCS6138729.1 Cro/Cl family transcriptional regulator [Shewanella baltica]MCS6144918.1 Cro/Cl family transcriptional regulator [Shewanella baltica]MCS6169448.1 Cro/Cl family transcriptional regulator [Shewanella baltica]MCS6186672.1 Cro/Cl family transcriptional regulator [Shewanella baltica]